MVTNLKSQQIITFWLYELQYFSRCMPFFILAGKVVPLEGTKSALIMSFPAQTINKMPFKTSHIIVIHSHA